MSNLDTESSGTDQVDARSSGKGIDLGRLNLPTVISSGGAMAIVLYVFSNIVMPQVISAARDESKEVVADYIRRHEEYPHRNAASKEYVKETYDELQSEIKERDARYKDTLRILTEQIAELTRVNARIEAQLEIVLKKGN